MTDYEKLGPYLIKEKLGQGGMGAVYRGEHEKSGEVAAIKVLTSRGASQKRFRIRFKIEIETLKKLDHPNIVGMSGYGEEQGDLFYAMELIEGPSLQKHLKAEKRLHWDVVIQYGIDICAALKHAHDQGVVHRDLKPANLMIAPDGRIMVTDFGIAHLWGGENVTAEGAMLGTADYMAPEQAIGGPVSQRTDLYALGNVLYACLVGRPPFAGKQLTKVITSLREEPPPPIDLILPELPSELALLIHQLLEKKAEGRPPTALAVGNRLRSMQKGLQRSQHTEADETDAPTVASPDDPAELGDLSLEFGTAPSVPTDERPTLDATAGSAFGTGSNAGTEETIDSLDSPLPASGTFAPQTHFRTVDQEERRKASAPITAEEDEPRNLEGILSVVALVGFLIALIGFAMYLMRTEAADAIYARIQEKYESGELPDADKDIEKFILLHPDDPRFEEVSNLADRLNSDRVIRRIFRTQPMELTPSEHALKEALLKREESIEEAVEMMRDWLVVYQDANDLRTKKLIPVVQDQIEKLTDPDATWENPRGKKLKAYIERSLNEKDPQEHRKFLEAIQRLYKETHWAEEELQRVQELLESLPASESSE